MVNNDLVVNHPRLGWFLDDLPDEVTPPTATMLQDDGQQITLTVPWRVDEASEQIRRWFTGNLVSYADDPGRTKYSYEVPGTLGFYDVDGAAVLVGCSNGGYNNAWKKYPSGRGTVRVQLAVLGTGNLKFSSIDGLRTEIPELAEWVGLTSLHEEVHRNDAGRATGVTVDLQTPDSIRLSPRLNLSLVPSWRTAPTRNGPLSLHDEVFIETRVRRARSWDDHLQAHQLVREMIDIAAWRPFGYRQISALRDDQPIRDMEGHSYGDTWYDVRTYAVRLHKPAERPRFLFRFGNVGAAGFRRWMRTRDYFARGVTPLLSLLDTPAPYIESQLTQSAIGLEAIGYRIARDRGISERQAGSESLSQRLRRLEADLPLGVVLPGWPQRTADAYNGVKHANRTKPDFTAMLNAHRENIVVFRTWAATQMGVAPEVLAGLWTLDADFRALQAQRLAPTPVPLRKRGRAARPSATRSPS